MERFGALIFLFSMGGALGAAYFVRSHPGWSWQKRRRGLTSAGRFVLGGLYLGAVVGALVSIGVDLASSALAWMASSSDGQHVGLTAGALICALLLFALRKYQRILYGVLEVIVAAVGLIVYPVAPSGTAEVISAASAGWAIGIMALIYIAVRGLDNVDVGFKERWAKRVERPAAEEDAG